MTLLIRMRDGKPIEEEPRIVLLRWRVMQAEERELHLVGVRSDSHLVRVSSPLVCLDTELCSALTASGRGYQLSGPYGAGGDCVALWSAWAAVNHIASWRDVTEECFPRPYRTFQ